MTTIRPTTAPDRPTGDDGARLSDATWDRVAPLVPPRPSHPLGCHNPRLPDRLVMDAILLVFRTRGRWADLSRLGICSTTPAFRRFQEWTDAGFLAALQALHDPELDALAGTGWACPPRRKRPRGLSE